MHLMWHSQGKQSLLWVLCAVPTSLAMAGFLFTCSDGSWRYTVFSMLEPSCLFGISTSHNYLFRPLFWTFTTGSMILVESTRPTSHLCCPRISQMTLCSAKPCLSFNWGRLSSYFSNFMYFVLPKKSLFFIERNFNVFHIFWVNFIFFTGIS